MRMRSKCILYTGILFFAQKGILFSELMLIMLS